MDPTGSEIVRKSKIHGWIDFEPMGSFSPSSLPPVCLTRGQRICQTLSYLEDLSL